MSEHPTPRIAADGGSDGASRVILVLSGRSRILEDRRANGRVAVRVDPKILDSYVGQYQFETLDNRIFTITREGLRR